MPSLQSQNLSKKEQLEKALVKLNHPIYDQAQEIRIRIGFNA
tara:strand:- start:646 stop:771 length:126 start_codon:yes stop_codon:yes gene_type:complete